MLKYSDVDKDSKIGQNFTCWLATASNMLAGAGYIGGDGNEIYKILIRDARFIYANTWHSSICQSFVRTFFINSYVINGFVYNALNYYVKTYPETNKYTEIRAFGNKSNSPLIDTQLLQAMKDCLSRGYMVSLSLGSHNFSSTHAVTLWKIDISGDLTKGDFSSTITITDSDYDAESEPISDLNVYNVTYDNENGGWYFDITANKTPVYIKYFVVLGDKNIETSIPESIRNKQLYTNTENPKTSFCSF